MTRRRLLAGNWKMNGSRAALAEVAEIDARAADLDIVLFLPAPLIAQAAASARHVAIGAQDCHAESAGAYTGSISGALLADAGAGWTLAGHSESRRDARLSDGDVARKIAAAMPLLRVMLCVGEAGRGAPAGEIVDQLIGSIPADMDPARLAVAYEPVWAIGTGDTPSPSQIGEVHRQLHEALGARFGIAGEQVPILYGGSVTARNAGEILAAAHVDGLLVGGASLTAASFVPIMEAMAQGRRAAA